MQHTHLIGELLSAIFDELKEQKEIQQQFLDVMKRVLKDRDEEKEQLYTVAEASAYTGKSQQTIHRYLRDGKLMKVHRDCRIGIPKSMLDRIIR